VKRRAVVAAIAAAPIAKPLAAQVSPVACGTYTPALVGGGVGSTVSVAKWSRVGNVVTLSGRLTVSAAA
jgi:hypothetical protein